MLGMPNYSQDYIDQCRARVNADLKAYATQAGKNPSKEFENRFFNNQVLLLDRGKLQIDKLPDWPNSAGSSLKLPPDKSVLKLKAGNTIALTHAEFVRLADAFFAEIEKKYLAKRAAEHHDAELSSLGGSLPRRRQGYQTRRRSPAR